MILCLFLLLSSLAAHAEQRLLTIYSYDSFLAKGGLGAEIIPMFEKNCHCQVRALPSGDGGQLLTRMQVDVARKKSLAQVVVGLDQQLWEQAKPLVESWGHWLPKGYADLKTELKLESGFLPFEYGVFSFMADMKSVNKMDMKSVNKMDMKSVNKIDKLQPKLPTKLDDLLKPEWKRNIILEDPRTSTPGLAFLLYTWTILDHTNADQTKKEQHQEFLSFWRALQKQWLTLTPGWDGAYGLFLKGEAPLVWSYTTSQAYHEEHELPANSSNARRYRAVIFENEGQPLQIEGATLMKYGINSESELKLAKEFLEFLLSPQVQSKIPTKNWMFPVLDSVTLPASFLHLPHPKKLIPLRVTANQVKEALAAWEKLILQ